jgi:hypothetical protein
MVASVQRAPPFFENDVSQRRYLLDSAFLRSVTGARSHPQGCQDLLGHPPSNKQQKQKYRCLSFDLKLK